MSDDLVKRWKEPARRDDVLNTMVPSDIRQLVGEIERKDKRIEELEAENDKASAKLIAYGGRIDDLERQLEQVTAERDEAFAQLAAARIEIGGPNYNATLKNVPARARKIQELYSAIRKHIGMPAGSQNPDTGYQEATLFFRNDEDAEMFCAAVSALDTGEEEDG